MEQISSVQNPIIKMVASLHRKKNRQEAGLFIIEGFKGVEDALRYGIKITHIFINQSAMEKTVGFPQNIVYQVNEKVLKKISATDSPCEVMAVAKQFQYRTEDLVKEENSLVIVLEDIKDSGNLGTIIRTSKAAGVSGIILTGNSADIFNPKTVRSSAGNLWKIPILYLEDKTALKQTLKSHKDFQFISTVVTENTKNYFEIDYKIPSVVMFGSEAKGLSEELINQSDLSVKIPMHSEVESLNLSVSAGVILYEAFLQKNFPAIR